MRFQILLPTFNAARWFERPTLFRSAEDPRIHSEFFLGDPASRWMRVKRSVSDWRRTRQNKKMTQRFLKKPIGPYADHGYSVFGHLDKINGLSRAFRYEVERLKSEGLYNPQSRNVLVLGQPREWRKLFANAPTGFDDTYRIGMWVTEFEAMPPDWAFATDIVHEIWTPSEFSARALRPTGLPVKVVPHAVKPPLVDALPRARFGVKDTDSLGLAIMDLGTCPNRKNPLAHIAAWQQAFGDDPEAVLLIKAKFSRHKPYVRETLERAIGAASNIRFVEEKFSDDEMTGFQRMADVYLSLHRAEGYGLNIQEMLELGIPVIATGFSGNMDFMPNYPHAHSVPYRLVPYFDPSLHYLGFGLRWAEADIEAAVKSLNAIAEKYRHKKI